MVPVSKCSCPKNTLYVLATSILGKLSTLEEQLERFPDRRSRRHCTVDGIGTITEASPNWLVDVYH